MKQTIKECPKTYEAYKNWLIEGLKKKYPEQEMFATDNLIELSLTESPMSCIYYFDTINMVGALHYIPIDNEFLICVNGETINVHEDHTYHKDRRKAEKMLIKYLFIETEKTL